LPLWRIREKLLRGQFWHTARSFVLGAGFGCFAYKIEMRFHFFSLLVFCNVSHKQPNERLMLFHG
jgi:hypothetical protein